jgi:hypothetical protein
VDTGWFIQKWKQPLWLGLGIFTLFSFGCTKIEPPEPIEETFESVLVDTSAQYSPLRYADGELSVNNRCPIRRNKLDPKVRPLFVNGKPMGFC